MKRKERRRTKRTESEQVTDRENLKRRQTEWGTRDKDRAKERKRERERERETERERER